MEFSATLLFLLFCSTNIRAAVKPWRDPFMIYENRYPSSVKPDTPEECYGVPEFRPNTVMSIYFVLESGTRVAFNPFTQKFESYPHWQKYKGGILPTGSIPSEFVKGCKQFWIKIHDDSHTSYECCESTGISLRLRKTPFEHQAILEAAVSKNCFEGKLCKPKSKGRCNKCRNDNGGLGYSLLYLHTKPGKYSGRFQILGGSGFEQTELRYPMRVNLEGIPEEIFIFVE